MLQKSIYRHLLHFSLVLVLIGIGFWYGSEGKAELKGELNAHEDEIKELRGLVSEIAKQPKVNVQNEIQDVKVKDGSQLNFIPETDIKQFNISDPEPPKQKPIPAKNQKKINNLQDRLNNLKEKGKRPKRQIELQNKIDRLREPS